MSMSRQARFARLSNALATVMVAVLGLVLALSPTTTTKEPGRGGGVDPCTMQCDHLLARDLRICEDTAGNRDDILVDCDEACLGDCVEAAEFAYVECLFACSLPEEPGDPF